MVTVPFHKAVVQLHFSNAYKWALVLVKHTDGSSEKGSKNDPDGGRSWLRIKDLVTEYKVRM